MQGWKRGGGIPGKWKVYNGKTLKSKTQRRMTENKLTLENQRTAIDKVVWKGGIKKEDQLGSVVMVWN